MGNKKTSRDIPPETGKKTMGLEEILKEAGISFQKEYNLILWNDNVNNMMDVVVALYEVVRLGNEDCVRVMMEAHTKGKSVAKNGDLDELLDLKSRLEARMLTVTIDLAV